MTPIRRRATERHTGRPVLLDDDPEAYRLGTLTPLGAAAVTGPLPVRAIETPAGWRGFAIDSSGTLAAPVEWPRDAWAWQDAEVLDAAQ